MTTTLTPTTATAAPIDAAICSLDDAAATLERAAADGDRGAGRIAGRLARQARAAARLLARGRHLGDAPAARGELLARRATRVAGDDDLCASTAMAMRAYIRDLHAWRGHTASLPTAD